MFDRRRFSDREVVVLRWAVVTDAGTVPQSKTASFLEARWFVDIEDVTGSTMRKVQVIGPRQPQPGTWGIWGGVNGNVTAPFFLPCPQTTPRQPKRRSNAETTELLQDNHLLDEYPTVSLRVDKEGRFYNQDVAIPAWPAGTFTEAPLLEVYPESSKKPSWGPAQGEAYRVKLSMANGGDRVARGPQQDGSPGDAVVLTDQPGHLNSSLFTWMTWVETQLDLLAGAPVAGGNVALAPLPSSSTPPVADGVPDIDDNPAPAGQLPVGRQVVGRIVTGSPWSRTK